MQELDLISRVCTTSVPSGHDRTCKNGQQLPVRSRKVQDIIVRHSIARVVELVLLADLGLAIGLRGLDISFLVDLRRHDWHCE